MYDRVLFPTDGSDESTASVVHAIELANRFDASIHVLHVIDTRVYDAEGIGNLVIDDLEQRGTQHVDTIADTISTTDTIPVETAVVRGGPVDEILAYVDEHDIDVIVMSTHGRSGVDRYILGSVTEAIIRSASVPVHTVPIDSTVEE